MLVIYHFPRVVEIWLYLDFDVGDISFFSVLLSFSPPLICRGRDIALLRACKFKSVYNSRNTRG